MSLTLKTIVKCVREKTKKMFFAGTVVPLKKIGRKKINELIQKPNEHLHGITPYDGYAATLSKCTGGVHIPEFNGDLLKEHKDEWTVDDIARYIYFIYPISKRRIGQC